MSEDVLDIIHRISFNVDDANLEQLTTQLRRQTETINQLGQRQARLAQAYDRTSATEIERRRRISSLMERNNQLLQQNARTVENTVLNNRQLNDQLTRELGLIGAINARLDILQQRRRQATSESDVRRYSNSIASEQRRLDNLNRVPRNTASGFLGNIGQMGGAGIAVSSLLPAIGGALGIASLGSQMVDVTKKFEGYIQTLKNAYGSSVKAEGAFSKIQQFAAKTPYSVDELTSSFIKLKNRGFDPTTAELTKLGDLASSQGKSFDQLTEAVLDAQTGENERLKEFGIKAKTVGDQVIFTFKGVSKTVSKFSEIDIRNTIIGFGELKGVIGGMAGQATTLEGKMSNLGDTVDMLMFTLSKRLGMNSFLGSLVEMANEALDALRDLLDNSVEIAKQSREDATSAKALADEYDNLAGKTRLSADEKDRLKIIQGQLVSVLGDSILVYNKETKAMEINMKAVRDLIRQKLILSNTKAVELITKANENNANLDINNAKIKNANDEKNAIIRQNPNVLNDVADFEKMFYSKPEHYQTFYNNLSKAGKRIVDLNGYTRELTGANLKLHESNNKLGRDYYNVTNGSLRDGITAVTPLDLGEEEVINIPPTTTTPKKNNKKTTVKSETPQEKELKRLSELEKIAQEEEKQRNAQYIIDQNEFLNKQNISKSVFDARIQRNTETHEKRLLEIIIKYSRLKSKFQNGSEREGSETSVVESTSKLGEIEQTIKERAENEIKAAVVSFNQLNNEIFDLQKESDEKELQMLQNQHQKKLDLIDKQVQEEKEKLKVAEDEKNMHLQAIILNNIRLLSDEKEKQIAKNDKDLSIKEIDLFNKKIDLQTQFQRDSIRSFTQNERLNFVEKYLFKEENNEKERKQLLDSGKNKEELEQRTQLALLFIDYNAENIKLGRLAASGIATKEEIKKQESIVDSFGKQIGQKDDEITEGKKKRTKATKEDYQQLGETAVQAAQTITSAFEQQADREIEIRQRRVDQTREIADRGNAEALQEEERRLDKAVKTKQRFAKQQIAINLLMQASQIALAIATAAGGTGVAAPAAIAIVLAALATGFAAVKGFNQDTTPAFKDGVIGFNGKGSGTSDSNLVRISNGESVITADATAKNKAILEEINSGKVFKPLEFNPGNVQPVSSSNSYDFSRLENKIESLKEDIKSAISERTPNSVSIDRRGFVAMSEEVQTINRKRNNL